MNDVLVKMGSDSSLMFIGAMVLVVLLFIVLVVVVSSMRVKTYKDRFVNSHIDNQEKEKLIVSLQKELQIVKIKNAQDEQELQHFEQTKTTLLKVEEALVVSQKELNELSKLQSQTQAQFENAQNMYKKLSEEYTSMHERFDTLAEDNSKIRINNARLLMKLETEARFASQLNTRSSKTKKDL